MLGSILIKEGKMEDGPEKNIKMGDCIPPDGCDITRNSAKCLKCNDEIESFHRHDFKHCSCGNIFVDGGLEYTRHGFVIFDDYIDTSERTWITEDKGGEDAVKERQVKEDNF